MTLMYSYCHKIYIVKIGSTKLAHTAHIGKLKGDMIYVYEYVRKYYNVTRFARIPFIHISKYVFTLSPAHK